MANETKNVLSLESKDAMDFFLKSEQYHGFELPEYFVFDELLQNIKEVLEYAQNELGLKDMYNSDNGFISKKMSSISSQMRDANGNLWGRLKRNDRDICKAVLIKGPLTFKKQSSEQGVVSQECKDEAVLVKQGDDVRLAQLDVFLRTYKNTDASALTKDSITKAEYTA